MLHPNCEKVQQALLDHGIDSKVLELASSTKTSAEAASSLGVDVAQIAKSLIFQTEESPILIIASGKNQVDLNKIESYLGKKVTRMKPDLVKEIIGFPIGGVAPVAHQCALTTYIDKDLLQYDFVWAAAGTPNTVFRCTPSELVKISSGVVADLAVV